MEGIRYAKYLKKEIKPPINATIVEWDKVRIPMSVVTFHIEILHVARDVSECC